MSQTETSARPPITPQAPDLREKGRGKDGQAQYLDRRLFMQLLAFGNCSDPLLLVKALSAANISGVLYEDLHDPRGVALLTFSEDAKFFVDVLRAFLNKAPFKELSLKPELSLFGRTYALGHEPNLEDWLIQKPQRTVSDPNWPWAVWYPLRRSGAFALLAPEEQSKILREHGMLGHAFGSADLGRDVRLACQGLDRNDNDFVIGLIGKELHPLSALVAAMRPTTQTSTYIQNMGPFFVGKAIWQSKAVNS